MNRKLTVSSFLVFIFLLFSCSSEKKNGTQDEEVEIDLLPLYGSTPEFGSHKKTSDQIESDRIFLINSDEIEPERKRACITYLAMAWQYIEQNNADNAMRRTNRAWLLDALNPDVYVTFAHILNKKEDHAGALDMLDRALGMAPDQINIYEIYLAEAYDHYKISQDNSFIQKLLDLLNKLKDLDEEDRMRVEKMKEDASIYLKS